MSRQGVCSGCHGKGFFLDRCRGCAGWFCNLCFGRAASMSGNVQHEKMRKEDLEAMDAALNSKNDIGEIYKTRYMVFE